MSQQNINNYSYYYDVNQPTYPSNTYSTFITTIPTEKNFTQQSLYASDYQINNDHDHSTEPFFTEYFGNTHLDDGVISTKADYLNNSNPQIQKLVEAFNHSKINNIYYPCYKLISCEKTESDQAEFTTPESYRLHITPRLYQNFDQNEEIPCSSLVLCQSENEPIISTPLSTVIHQHPINPVESLTEEQTNDDNVSSNYFIKKTSTMIIQSETSPETLKKYEMCEEFFIYYEKRCQVYEGGEMETFEEQVVKMDKKMKVEILNGYS
ncbi:hypothetical protein C2G38_2114874 [Gigaspora rosea]|uniref:Uncharacterized protein n=1 Tax=Gigaspora rosea TaxID=44941 RepID=A0A397UIJ4_9GLOM|nr:hypothetical protein C2G38_2114874 [Gigaspora rosea]